MRFKITALNAATMGGSVIINMIIPHAYSEAVNGLIGGFKAGNEYELKQYKQKRSLNANNYMWLIADEIAKVLHSTKEEVYRKAVGDVGVFYEIEFKSSESMQAFKRIWHSNGTGWLTKSLDEVTLHAYKGSSKYNTQEMSRLIDYIVEEAKELGIETKPQEEIDALLKSWGEK